MIRKSILLFTVMVGMASTQVLRAQAITIEDVLDSWDRVTKMVVESAKLMPAADFNFTPGKPLRSFADQINHTTRSNLGFASAVNAGEIDFPVDPRNPPKDKEAVVALLEKSFAFFRKGLAGLSTDDLAGTVPWGRPGNQRPISRLKAVLIVTSHLQREHGKTMMYLRAKGIKPAPAGSW